MAEDVYRRLSAHIRALSDDPTTTQDIHLFEEAEMVLPTSLKGTTVLWDRRLTLMRSLAADLMDRRRADHTSVVNLLIKFFDGWSWQQVSEFDIGSVPYADGLAAGEGMEAYNRLMICLLGKATQTSGDAAQAAGMLEAMQALVKLWLQTSDTGVATQAGSLLLDLLKVDCPAQATESGEVLPTRVTHGGQGLVWKRIFGDRDVYTVFFESCSLAAPNGLSRNQKTVAQARLMEWLPEVGRLNWDAIQHSHHREVEARYGVQGGLLDFAALKMVDYKEDVLMHRCLVEFFSGILYATRPLDTHTMVQHDSLGLQYLIMHGLHARTTAIYLQLPGSQTDPIETMFLYGPAAAYIATYASSYPDHFLASQMPQQVIDRLKHTLDLTPARWAHSDSPKHDLHLAASLPRKSLLPNQDGSTSWSSSPLSLLPSRATNPDVLNTLAAIFHGPERQVMAYPPQSQNGHDGTNKHRESEEGTAARALYYHYLAFNPRFWQDITTHADTVALIDLALAAINVLTSVITANWPASPAASTSDLTVPSTLATPESGHLAILAPPALEYTLPYLFKPPQTFANLVGGRGDAESSAYKVAMAKYDALRALNSQLMVQVERTPGEGYEDILGTIGKKLAEGPFSREGEVGGRIGTLEL